LKARAIKIVKYYGLIGIEKGYLLSESQSNAKTCVRSDLTVQLAMSSMGYPWFIIRLNVVIIQLSFILYFSTFQIVESSIDVLSLSFCVSTLLYRGQQFGNMRS
jgi:hypothetical protein